jgi:small conductance mechanosensitive channel
MTQFNFPTTPLLPPSLLQNQTIQPSSQSSQNLPGQQQINENMFMKQLENLIQHQIGSFVFYIILTVGSIFAVINLGFNVTTIITILASMGLAIGIAMQGALGNIISGIIISINDIFNINDIIKINNILNDNTIYGKVIDFNLYFTTIYDPLKKSIVTVPNSTIQNNLLTNVSRSKLLIKK